MVVCNGTKGFSKFSVCHFMYSAFAAVNLRRHATSRLTRPLLNCPFLVFVDFLLRFCLTGVQTLGSLGFAFVPPIHQLRTYMTSRSSSGLPRIKEVP